MLPDEVLTRAVAQILPSKEALKKFMDKRKITLYLGIDPSNPQIHLGNAVALRKLSQFQALGHKVILLIGDFTGMIGDPTDKTAARPRLSHQQVLVNAKTYREQASKILRFEGTNPAQIKFNSTWLAKMSIEDFIELAANLTVGQLEERDMFVRRKKEGKAVFVHEFLYPMMQGYDSVAMNVDLEIGGTDQTFNMLVGRDLMKALKNKEKFVLTVPLLLGLDGQKMGKSTGNFIAIGDSQSDMFGKVLSIDDNLIKQYFELTTDIDLSTLDFSQNPLTLKKRLAWEIVKIYHGQKAAQKAQEEFERVFQKGQKPQEAEAIKVVKSKWQVADFLTSFGLASSRSQAKRLIDGGAVEVNGKTLHANEIEFKNGQIVRVGKKKFVRIELK